MRRRQGVNHLDVLGILLQERLDYIFFDFDSTKKKEKVSRL